MGRLGAELPQHSQGYAIFMFHLDTFVNESARGAGSSLSPRALDDHASLSSCTWTASASSQGPREQLQAPCQASCFNATPCQSMIGVIVTKTSANRKGGIINKNHKSIRTVSVKALSVGPVENIFWASAPRCKISPAFIKRSGLISRKCSN